jgi:hypothetical protein
LERHDAAGTLGTQGLQAGAIGLGVMGMSVGYGPGGDAARHVATIRRVLDLGVTMLDTTEAYGGGRVRRRPSTLATRRGGRTGREIAARVVRRRVGEHLLPRYNMLRVFKPRSPMSMGSWCLTAFGGLGAGVYLGSYAGVLLASTAVPVWARSRLFLGPIFISTATVSGAAATRLALAGSGMQPGHRTRAALARVENGAMAAELIISEINHQRLGRLASGLDEGAGARWFRAAQWFARGGLTLRFAGRGPAEHGTSLLFMASAPCVRFAWVRSGRSSAQDDETVAEWRARVERCRIASSAGARTCRPTPPGAAAHDGLIDVRAGGNVASVGAGTKRLRSRQPS